MRLLPACPLSGGYLYVTMLHLPSVQAVMDCVVNPPRPGDPSYELFSQERDAVLSSLKERAALIADTFNAMEGFRCNQVQGAMYAFPQVRGGGKRGSGRGR